VAWVVRGVAHPAPPTLDRVDPISDQGWFFPPSTSSIARAIARAIRRWPSGLG
jgi:hypothetical protein